MSWGTHISLSTTHPLETEQTENIKKFSFMARNATFCFCLNHLLNSASIESLKFISELAERLESPDFDYENETGQELELRSEQLEELISDIDRLFLWCHQHLADATITFEDWSERDVKQAIAIAEKSTVYPDDGYFGDSSDTPEFLFSALKAMQDIFQHAKENKMNVNYSHMLE